MTRAPSSTPVGAVAGDELPPGFGVVLDRSVRVLGGGRLLLGGEPGRLARLTPAGVAALDELTTGIPGSGAARRLGRRLVDAGMALPRPGLPPAPNRTDPRSELDGSLTPEDVTVVVPVRDRSAALERCLQSLSSAQAGLSNSRSTTAHRRSRVLVVDDGSTDPAEVRTHCALYGARCLRLAFSRGPAGARNAALREVTTSFVAFLDSDCQVPAGWLEALGGHFRDPGVAAVAPRVRPVEPTRPGRVPRLARYLAARSPLDLGPRGGLVRPGGRVPYVPTAALLVRRAALAGGFDEELRYGEDVDLVWRLFAEGWRVIYEPSIVVRHDEPGAWRMILVRRFAYGTSAASLAKRHPGTLAPLVLRPLPQLILLCLLARRPVPAAAAALVASRRLARRLHAGGVEIPSALLLGVELTVRGVVEAAESLGRLLAVLGGPAVPFGGLVAAAARRSRRGERRGERRGSALPWLVRGLGLVVLAPALDWARRRPDLAPPQFVVASLADDVAYGAGVWWSCLRSGELGPLIPVLSSARSGRESTRGGARKATSAPEAENVPPGDDFPLPSFAHTGKLKH